MDTPQRFTIFLLIIAFSFLFNFVSDDQAIQENLSQPYIKNIELGQVNFGPSSNGQKLGASYIDTYFKPFWARLIEPSNPYVFIQPMYGDNNKISQSATLFADNFSTTLADTNGGQKNAFSVNVHRIDAPKVPWGQDLQLLYGRVWVNGNDPYQQTTKATKITY